MHTHNPSMYLGEEGGGGCPFALGVHKQFIFVLSTKTRVLCCFITGEVLSIWKNAK